MNPNTRLTTVLGIIILVGFSILGIMIKSWYFLVAGVLFGLFFISLGYFIDGTLKKENGHQVLGKLLKIILPIIVVLNILMAISKFAS